MNGKIWIHQGLKKFKGPKEEIIITEVGELIIVKIEDITITIITSKDNNNSYQGKVFRDRQRSIYKRMVYSSKVI